MQHSGPKGTAMIKLFDADNSHRPTQLLLVPILATIGIIVVVAKTVVSTISNKAKFDLDYFNSIDHRRDISHILIRCDT